MEKKDRNKWTQKFRELGKKKGSAKDFAKLYREMKQFKEVKETRETKETKEEKN